MPEIDLDFGGVGAVPEEGTYRICVDKAIYKQNKAKDGYVISLQMHLVDMYDEDFENHKMWDNPSLATTARWKLKEVLDAFTFPQVWEEDGMKIEVDDDTNEVEMLKDTTALAICFKDDYDGRVTLKVKTYLPDNGQIEIGPSA